MLIAMAVYDTVDNNRTWMTEATLASLAKAVDWDRHRLIVVDNGSCDATHDLYSSLTHDYGETWRLIPLAHNYGTAKAINRAWYHRNPGEHCVKLDNDVVFHQAEWCDWMEDVFSRDPSIGICSLKRSDLAESPLAEGNQRTSIRMLPHEHGQRWIIVEDVKCTIGTCQAYSSSLLDKIGYLTQPGLYGFDDALAATRAELAGFSSVFLHGFEIDHVDPGGDAYCQWKIAQANKYWKDFNSQTLLYKTGVLDVYYDGGFNDA